jgi:hypothetical protein
MRSSGFSWRTDFAARWTDSAKWGGNAREGLGAGFGSAVEDPLEFQEGAFGGTLLGEDVVACELASLGRGFGVFQGGLEGLGEFVGVGDLAGGLMGEKSFDAIAEVRGMGSEEDVHAIGGGFHHVLSTPAGKEAAADEGKVGKTPDG